MPHVAKLLDRECPRCSAPAAIKCRDLRHRHRTADHEHVARGWLDRPCPTCDALPGERCRTAPGHAAAKAHRARWVQPRQRGERHGYMWVAPDAWELQRAEHEALRAAGCVRIWSDRPLNADETRTSDRAQLLEYLQAEDVLVVWRLDRLARTPAELAEITAALRARKIGLCSLNEELDSTKPGGEQLFAAVAAVARLQPAPVAADNVAKARAGGARAPAAKGGRPPLLDEHAHAAVRAMYDAGEHTIDQIAAAHGVSRPTVYRSLTRTRASQNT